MSLFGKDYYVIMIDDYGHSRCCVYVCWAGDREEFEWSHNPKEARMFETKEAAENYCYRYLDKWLVDDGLDWHVIRLSNAPRGYGTTEGCY